jgi:ABC-type transport system substrate-binding protein
VGRGYLPWPGQAAASLKTQLWENLKIQVKLTTLEDNTFYSALDAGSLPGMYLLGWGADYADVDNFLGTHFGARASLQFGRPDEEIAAVLERGAASGDPEEREAQYAEANTVLAQRVPMVPLVHGGWISPNVHAAAYAADVKGAHASPFGLEDFSLLSVAGQDSFTWIQTYEPLSLYCPQADDIESMRACAQVAETLYRFVPGSASVEPGLAEACRPDEGLQTWICTLRPGVRLHDGSLLDANDVAASFAAQWDAGSEMHRQVSEGFTYFSLFWPGFLNDNRP